MLITERNHRGGVVLSLQKWFFISNSVPGLEDLLRFLLAFFGF